MHTAKAFATVARQVGVAGSFVGIVEDSIDATRRAQSSLDSAAPHWIQKVPGVEAGALGAMPDGSLACSDTTACRLDGLNDC